MAVRPEAIPVPREEERIYIASQWTLIWRRLRKHRLALVSLAVLAAFYFIAIFAEFLAIHDPFESSSQRAYISPQRIHFDGIRPYVYGYKTQRDPVTLALKHVPDKSKKLYISFFVRGHEYKLLGLIRTNRHLVGINSNEKPVPFYPLGTDRMGRDMWSRLMYATRVSTSIGLVGVSLSLFLGILLGGLSGFFGGFIDVMIQRLIEFVRSMPTIPLWLALAAAVPQDWSIVKVYFAITIILSLVGWTTLAREVRGRFLAMREEDFVLAAKLYGSSSLRVIFRHMVPSFFSHIIAAATLAVPATIIGETSLSFLGLGLRQPALSWGVLLNEAQNIQSIALAPWLLIPGLFVIIVVLAFNFMGDGLRDAADPYSTKR